MSDFLVITLVSFLVVVCFVEIAVRFLTWVTFIHFKNKAKVETDEMFAELVDAEGGFDKHTSYRSWRPFTKGTCNLKFFDKKGKAFKDSMHQYLTLHGNVYGLCNETNNVVIFIDDDGNVVAKGNRGGNKTLSEQGLFIM